MTGAVPDANEAMRHYWNTVAGPRWVASPGFRERRNQESLALLLACLRLAGGESVLEMGYSASAGDAAPRRGRRRAWPRRRGRHLRADVGGRPAAGRRQRDAQCYAAVGDAQVFGVRAGRIRHRDLHMGVMFFADPVAAFRNIGGALKPGGRLVFACWAPLAENRHWLISRHRAPPFGAGAVNRS